MGIRVRLAWLVVCLIVIRPELGMQCSVDCLSQKMSDLHEMSKEMKKFIIRLSHFFSCVFFFFLHIRIYFLGLGTNPPHSTHCVVL
jgi:hypothetical protein